MYTIVPRMLKSQYVLPSPHQREICFAILQSLKRGEEIAVLVSESHEESHMAETQTMSQKLARDNLGNAQSFEGGMYVTKNGVAELFIQPAAERQAELREMEEERNINALFKLAMMAKKDIADGKGMSPEEALRRLRAARK